MTTEPFVPHADSIQTAWVLMCQQSRVSTQPPVEELEAEFDRFLTRVRREAKAEALREAAGDIVWSAETLPHMTPHDAARGLMRRATEYETGDRPMSTIDPFTEAARAEAGEER